MPTCSVRLHAEARHQHEAGQPRADDRAERVAGVDDADVAPDVRAARADQTRSVSGNIAPMPSAEGKHAQRRGREHHRQHAVDVLGQRLVERRDHAGEGQRDLVGPHVARRASRAR